ncbi:hypothetical protein ACIBIZ_23085 [Nonomuraea spiralis]|uniref:hypothetical protein n=1 Tax=Nonomuraea spiralis TaxID=46182 RepID=UPI00379A955C
MTADAAVVQRAVRDRLQGKLDLVRAWLTSTEDGGVETAFRRGAERSPRSGPGGADGLVWALVHLRDSLETLRTLDGNRPRDTPDRVRKANAALPALLDEARKTLDACQTLARAYLRGGPGSADRDQRHADVVRRLETDAKAMEDLQNEYEAVRADLVPDSPDDTDDAPPPEVPALSRAAEILDQARRCCLKGYLALRLVVDEEMLSSAKGTSLSPFEWPLLPYLDHQEVLLAYLDVPADGKGRDETDTLLAEALSGPQGRQEVHAAVEAVNQGR